MNWISKKLQNRIVRIILYFMIGLVLVSVAIPVFLEVAIWRNSIYSAISNSDWSSFLGSYLGGVIGGSATLLAVWITTMESKNGQYKETLARIIDICSSYINGINVIKENAEEAGRLICEINELAEDIGEIERNLSVLRAPSDDVMDDLKSRLIEQTENLSNIKILYNEVLAAFRAQRSVVEHASLMLEIYLYDIDFAKELLRNIEELNNTVKEIQNKLISNSDELDEVIIQGLSQEEIKKSVGKFVDLYRKSHMLT